MVCLCLPPRYLLRDPDLALTGHQHKIQFPGSCAEAARTIWPNTSSFVSTVPRQMEQAWLVQDKWSRHGFSKTLFHIPSQDP